MGIFTPKMVANIINKFPGVTTTFTVKGATFEPTTNTGSGGGATATAKSSPVFPTTGYETDDVIRDSDGFLWISTDDNSYTPILGDYVTNNSEKYKITKVKKFTGGGSTVVAYKIWVKK